jgi:hypothetical protein
VKFPCHVPRSSHEGFHRDDEGSKKPASPVSCKRKKDQGRQRPNLEFIN